MSYHSIKEHRVQKQKERERRKDSAWSVIKSNPDGLKILSRHVPSFEHLLTPADIEYILSNKDAIEKKQKEINNKRWQESIADDNFVRWQQGFCDEARSLLDEHISNWGGYYYFPTFLKRDSDGSATRTKLMVWQFFPNGSCLDESLDYSTCQHFSPQFIHIDELKSQRRSWTQNVYDNLNNFLESLNNLSECPEENPFAIIFNESKSDWSQSAYDFHYSKIRPNIPNCKIYHWKNDDLDGISDYKYCVIVDVYTENDELINNCERIFKKARTKLIYISLQKIYSTEEMKSIIKEAEIKKQKEEEEKKRIEEELRKKQLEDEQRRKEQAILQLQREQEIQKLTEKYCNLLPLFAELLPEKIGTMPYWHMLDYYPTTCDFKATAQMWDDRNTVWDFKNDPSKNISPNDHSAAMQDVIYSVSSELQRRFGADPLKILTLVCIPASSNSKNKLRYEDFSQQLCSRTGMTNSFDKITITCDATPKHEGGTGMPTLEFDNAFFKGKYIVLFDDVVTSGKSMIRFKQRLESLGAKVICAISIGKTKHTL